MEEASGKVGPYALVRRLAVGGMGEVYLAFREDGAGKPVALKRMLPDLAREEEYRHLFLDEARVVAHLDHPNIARIVDLGADGAALYLAMEYVRGVSLRDLMDKCAETKERVPPAIVVEIGLAVLDALAYAHDTRDGKGEPLGVVHRDVTPANVLVTFEGAVKLIDFGIAKSTKQRHKTEGGTTKGKLAYMSPEQARGQKCDRRSDLFSFGIVLCEALTGKNPFDRDDNMVLTLQAIADAPPVFPGAADPALAALDPVVAKLLAKKPEFRYANAQEARAALVEAAAALPKAETTLGALVTARFDKELGAEALAFADAEKRLSLAHEPTRLRPAAGEDLSAKPTELELPLSEIERAADAAMRKGDPRRADDPQPPQEPAVVVSEEASVPDGKRPLASAPTRLNFPQADGSEPTGQAGGRARRAPKRGMSLLTLVLLGLAAAGISAAIAMGVLMRLGR